MKQTVYLIHFNRSYRHARHYLGYSENLDKRICDHLCGQGARLMEASLNFATLNPKNGFTVLISRVENQIDYHTYNSSILKYLPKTGNLSAAVGAIKMCESVKPFPDRKTRKLSDALMEIITLAGIEWKVSRTWPGDRKVE